MDNQSVLIQGRFIRKQQSPSSSTASQVRKPKGDESAMKALERMLNTNTVRQDARKMEPLDFTRANSAQQHNRSVGEANTKSSSGMADRSRGHSQSISSGGLTKQQIKQATLQKYIIPDKKPKQTASSNPVRQPLQPRDVNKSALLQASTAHSQYSSFQNTQNLHKIGVPATNNSGRDTTDQSQKQMIHSKSTSAQNFSGVENQLINHQNKQKLLGGCPNNLVSKSMDLLLLTQTGKDAQEDGLFPFTSLPHFPNSNRSLLQQPHPKHQTPCVTFNGEHTTGHLQHSGARQANLDSTNQIPNILEASTQHDYQAEDPLGMSLLTQALQPDKIFDLPLALVKVQKAFQQANQNAEKLKDSLETVLQREQNLAHEVTNIRNQLSHQQDFHEQEKLLLKTHFKDQLLHFSESVQQLQGTLEDREQQVKRLQDVNFELKTQCDGMRDKLVLCENQKQMLQSQIARKSKDFDELRMQFEYLRKQEEDSSKELEKLQTRANKEEQRLRSLLEDKQILIDVLRQEVDCAKQEKELAEGQESRIMDELSKMRHALSAEEDKQNRYVLDLLEDKKVLLRECEELRCQLGAKTVQYMDLERRCAEGREQRRLLEDQIGLIKKDLNSLTRLNRDALEQQRASFESRLKEMEDEVTKVSLSRYKVELDQKQRYLQTSQRYEEGMRDLRACLAIIIDAIGIKEQDIPEQLKKPHTGAVDTIEGLRSLIGDNKDLIKVVNAVDRRMLKLLKQSTSQLEDQGQDEMTRINQGLIPLNKPMASSQLRQIAGGDLDALWKAEYEKLLRAYRTELNLRRTLHNQLQELRGNIRVLCRVRPLLPGEHKRRRSGLNPALKLSNQHKLVVHSEKHPEQSTTYKFDRIFDPSDAQPAVYEEVQHLVTSCLDGFNVCIMAYGQTGSGKTHTMVGNEDGIYYYAINELFKRLEDRPLSDHKIRVSLTEIYNETIRDLLPRKGDPVLVKLRDNAEGETVSDERVKTVRSREEVIGCLKRAQQNRSIGASSVNDQSSRSHFIFTIHVSWRHALSKARYSGKIHLVDLAGSERTSSDHTTTLAMPLGVLPPTSPSNAYHHQLQLQSRDREMVNINQSLSTLGKVFLALLHKSQHIPYRESKLTHYLKDSLGGDSKTMLIIQISPCEKDAQETLSTLNFGQRVSQIEQGQVHANVTTEVAQKAAHKLRSQSQKHLKSARSKSAQRSQNNSFSMVNSSDQVVHSENIHNAKYGVAMTPAQSTGKLNPGSASATGQFNNLSSAFSSQHHFY